MKMKSFLLLMSLFWLGSASGKHNSQEDVLSDAEALYETSASKNTLNEHTVVEHTSGVRAVVEHTPSERSVNEHTSGEHTVAEHSSGERVTGEQTSSDSPAEQLNEKTSSESPSEQSMSEQSSSDTSSSDQPSGDKSLSEKSSSEQPSNEKSSSEQSSSGEKVSGEQPSVTSTTTVTNPPLNCHTCSYMNDEKKCLRGEGVCTTQNSQQCMLKKIYEGGKLQFMVQGCENMCPSMNLFSHGTRMQIICCRNQSFCNKI